MQIFSFPAPFVEEAVFVPVYAFGSFFKDQVADPGTGGITGITHACNPNYLEAEIRRMIVQSQQGLIV
jgi:hypothetical protein